MKPIFSSNTSIKKRLSFFENAVSTLFVFGFVIFIIFFLRNYKAEKNTLKSQPDIEISNILDNSITVESISSDDIDNMFKEVYEKEKLAAEKIAAKKAAAEKAAAEKAAAEKAAAEKAAAEKAAAKKAAAEKAAAEKAAAEKAAAKKAAAKKAAAKKAAAEKAAAEKAAAEKAAAEKAAAKKAAAEKAAAKKAAAEKAAAEKAAAEKAAAEKAAAEKIAAEKIAAEIEATRKAQLQKLNQATINHHQKLIIKTVESNWVLPPKLPRGLVVKLKVITKVAGDVDSVQVIKSSGNIIFDQAAIEAVKRASPLPLPKKQELAEIFHEFTFNFNPR